MKTYSDLQIVEALRSGKDEIVISSLYKNVFPIVKRYIVSNSGSAEEAYDIFQDAMVLFYNQVRENSFSLKYKVHGFLYTVSKNLWINRAKKLNRNTSLEEVKDFEIIEDNILLGLVSEEKKKLVLSVFSRLDDRCKEVLRYSVFLKMSMEDIMGKMGFTSVNATKTQNYRCKKMLSDKAKESPLYEELKALYHEE